MNGVWQLVFDIIVLLIGSAGFLTLFLKYRHEKKIKELDLKDKEFEGDNNAFMKESEQVTLLINAVVRDNEAWKSSYECMKKKLDASREQMKLLHKEISDLTKEIKKLEMEAVKNAK